MEDRVQRTTHICVKNERLQITSPCQLQQSLPGKKEDFISNDVNKQALIYLIANCLQEKGCHVIHADGEADVDIVSAAIKMASHKSRTLIGEDIYLLVLLLYHAAM